MFRERSNLPPIGAPMIRVAITPAAFEANVATLPLGSVAFEHLVNARVETAAR